MYSSEMEQFVRDRNYNLSSEDAEKIINIVENPQIKSMKYFCDGNRCVVVTEDGYTLEFSIKTI